MARPLTIAWLRLAALAVAGVAGPASAVTLYDPGLGTLPSMQGWSTTAAGSFTQGVDSGSYSLDTTAASSTRAGSIVLDPTQLDTGAGFTLDFGLRIVSESHAADNQRAGFSLIVTGADPRQSLELGFRQDEIFAYTAGFEPGASASFATAASTAYSLVVADDRYRLFGNGALLLGGSLVDNTSRGAPYTTPGAIFFGDDTTRAQSSSQLGVVTLGVAAVPEPQTVALLALGLAALALRRRSR